MNSDEFLNEDMWDEEFLKNSAFWFGNSSNNFSMETLMLGQEFHVPLIIVATVTIQAIISFFGIIFNILVVVVLTFNRNRQDKSSVTYMINLATSDCLFLLTVPFKIVENIFLRWDMGQFLCKLINLITYLNFLVSPWFLTIMSIDRFLAINRALSSTRFRTKRVSRYVSAFAWFVSLICVFPIAMFHSASDQMRCTPKFPNSELYNTNNYDANFMSSNMTFDFEMYFQNLNSTEDLSSLKSVCKYTDPSPSFIAWTICNFLYSFFIPLLIIISCYFAIVRKLYAPDNLASFEGRVRANHNATRKRVLAMVAILVLIYIFCYLPYYLWQILKINGVPVQHVSTCSHLERFNSTMAYLNSAINPIIYVFISGEFSKKVHLTSRNLFRRVRNMELNAVPKSKANSQRSQNNNPSISKGLLNSDEIDHKNDNDITKEQQQTKNITVDTAKEKFPTPKIEVRLATSSSISKDSNPNGKTKAMRYIHVPEASDTSITFLADEKV